MLVWVVIFDWLFFDCIVLVVVVVLRLDLLWIFLGFLWILCLDVAYVSEV